MIVGTGELGPGGTGRSRFALELDELDSPGVVAELAWLTGLVALRARALPRPLDRHRHRRGGARGAARRALRRRRSRARVGLRALEDDGTIDAAGHTVLAPVTLERAARPSRSTPRRRRARSGADAGAPRSATRWRVTQPAGAQIRVPRVVPHTRRVAGQLPTGPRPRPLRRPRRPDRHRRPDGAGQPRLHRRGVRRRRPHARGAARRRPPGPGGQHAGRGHGRDGVAAAPAARPPARRARARTTACRSRSATSSPPTRSRPTSAPTGR